jgi:hypothetical protein
MIQEEDVTKLVKKLVREVWLTEEEIELLEEIEEEKEDGNI